MLASMSLATYEIKYKLLVFPLLLQLTTASNHYTLQALQTLFDPVNQTYFRNGWNQLFQWPPAWCDPPARMRRSAWRDSSARMRRPAWCDTATRMRRPARRDSPARMLCAALLDHSPSDLLVVHWPKDPSRRHIGLLQSSLLRNHITIYEVGQR